MHIKRLYIGDFGIFRNQHMDDISPGLVVVGGLNRAGKTTLMTVLNRLGYGITNTKQLPPPNNRYYVEADVCKKENNETYNIRLDGFSSPRVQLLHSDEYTDISISDLYHVDEFTYKQLYTISLSQLVKVPEDVENKDILKLQSILLGAGLSDIMEIAGLEQEFRKKANSIGGVRGDINKKDFRPFVNQIKGGVEKKKKALQYIDEYSKKTRELSDLDKKIEQEVNSLKEQKARTELLEIVEKNLGLYNELCLLKQKLDSHEGRNIADSFPIEKVDRVKAHFDDYKGINEEYEKKQIIVKEKISSPSWEIISQKLQENSHAMDLYYKGISGLKERLSSIEILNKRLHNDKNDIVISLRSINNSWTEDDILHIESMKLDLLEEGKLIEADAGLKECNNQIYLIGQKLEEATAEYNALKSTVKEEGLGVSGAMKGYIFIYVIAAVLGLILYGINSAIGLVTFLFGLGGSVLYFTYKMAGQKSASVRNLEISPRLKELEGRIERYKVSLRKYEESGEKWCHVLNQAAEIMKLDLNKDDLSLRGRVLESFRAIRNIQIEILKYKTNYRDYKDAQDELLKEIFQLDKTLSLFDGLEVKNDQFTLSQIFNSVLSRFELWYDVLQSVRELEKVKSEKDNIEKKLTNLIGNFIALGDIDDAVDSFLRQGDIVKEYIKLKDKAATIGESIKWSLSGDRITRLVENYSGKEFDNITMECLFELLDISPYGTDVITMYQDSLRLQAEIDNALEKLKENRQRLKKDLDELSQATDIQSAQRTIDEGKSSFFPVAYKYAVYSAASQICNNIRTSFMERMKDELTAKAGEIFSTFTGGEYLSIKPDDDFNSPDFNFSLKDGSIQESVEKLSRGTKEQVFLSVRLGRIVDIKPALPVIIDDTFVNFDRYHLNNLMLIVEGLIKTHQVFILTCHPHLIDMIKNAGLRSQYWYLNKGVVSRTDGDELVKRLNPKNCII